MTFEQFAYWLQGFAEINGNVPSNSEWKMIKEHLATCFNKVTPPKEFNFPDNPWKVNPWDNNPWDNNPWDMNKWKVPPATCTNPLVDKPILIC